MDIYDEMFKEITITDVRCKLSDEVIAICKENGIREYNKKTKVYIIELLRQRSSIKELIALYKKTDIKNKMALRKPVVTRSKKIQEVPKSVKCDQPVCSCNTMYMTGCVKAGAVLQTEDTGKIFEMAICLAYGIQYNGKYKYSMEIPEKLKQRLLKLNELFPLCRHTAAKGGRYDYTCLTDETKHLSAKSNKRDKGKVAPQVIGQSQPKKFCELIGIEYSTIFKLKQYIQNDIIRILPILVEYTFDCPNVYYNQEKNTIRYITLNTPIEWDKYHLKWTRGWVDWKNSSTLKIVIEDKEFAVLEFQFHTKSRTNMAIRWYYENFLSVFKDNLCIIHI